MDVEMMMMMMDVWSVSKEQKAQCFFAVFWESSVWLMLARVAD